MRHSSINKVGRSNIEYLESVVPIKQRRSTQSYHPRSCWSLSNFFSTKGLLTRNLKKGRRSKDAIPFPYATDLLGRKKQFSQVRTTAKILTRGTNGLSRAITYKVHPWRIVISNEKPYVAFLCALVGIVINRCEDIYSNVRICNPSVILRIAQNIPVRRTSFGYLRISSGYRFGTV